MQNSFKTAFMITVMGFLAMGFLAMGFLATPAMSGGNGPADGYTIHIQAPHMMADGTVGGPYHHYCKGIQKGEILQCMLFESTAPDAKLVAIEYFIAKDLARKNVPLIQWNRAFHDHQVEIDTGRVKILDVEDPKEVKALAEAAGKTDGVLFHLWGKDQVIPDGSVTTPTSLGHVFRTE